MCLCGCLRGGDVTWDAKGRARKKRKRGKEGVGRAGRKKKKKKGKEAVGRGRRNMKVGTGWVCGRKFVLVPGTPLTSHTRTLAHTHTHTRVSHTHTCVFVYAKH